MSNLWPNRFFEAGGMLLGAASTSVPPRGNARRLAVRDHGNSAVALDIDPVKKTFTVEVTARHVSGPFLPLNMGWVRTDPAPNAAHIAGALTQVGAADEDGWARYSRTANIPAGYAKAYLILQLPQYSPYGTVWEVADLVHWYTADESPYVVRAQDQMTLQVLPSPSYSRPYFLLQGSELPAPAMPTTNPPPAPWSTTEPVYTAGSTSTLYIAWVTAYGSVAHEWSEVSKSASFEAAKQAYNLAAAAALNVTGKNARRVGQTQAELPIPPGGWTAGDEWLVTDATGRWVGMKVWNGTAFVPYQLAGDSLIIPGSVGSILLANGAVHAEHMDADVFTGRLFQGSTFELKTVSAMEEILYDPCEVVGSWTGLNGESPAALTRVTTPKKAGTYALAAVTYQGQKEAARAVSSTLMSYGGRCTVSLYSAVAGEQYAVLCGTGYQTGTLPANTWTDVVVEIPPTSGINPFVSHVSIWRTGTAALYLDEVRIARYTALAGQAGITRDVLSRATVYSESAAGRRAELADGEVLASLSGGRVRSRVEANPTGGNRAITEYRAAQLTSRVLEVVATDSGAQVSYSPTGDIYLPPRQISFSNDGIGLIGPVTLLAQPAWQGVSLPSGVTGTARWRVQLGVIYVEWSVTLATALGARAERQGIFTLPAEAVPGNPAPTAVTFNATLPGSGLVHTGGRVDVRNNHTSSQTLCRGSGQWLAA